MNNRFTSSFGPYVCEGATIHAEVEGFDIKARILWDGDYRLDDDDSHNPDQYVTGCNDEQQAKLLDAREAWFRDEWFYCGIVLSVSKNGVLLDRNAASMWGLEANYPWSDNAYLTEVANGLVGEAMEVGKSILAKLKA